MIERERKKKGVTLRKREREREGQIDRKGVTERDREERERQTDILLGGCGVVVNIFVFESFDPSSNTIDTFHKMSFS